MVRVILVFSWICMRGFENQWCGLFAGKDLSDEGVMVLDGRPRKRHACLMRVC